VKSFLAQQNLMSIVFSYLFCVKASRLKSKSLD